MVRNLRGVHRLIIAGGEPTLRTDLHDILSLCKPEFKVVALATNAVNIDPQMAVLLSSCIAYADVTVDGPRAVHDRIRGSYDAILGGLLTLKAANVAISIVTVLLDDNVDYISYVAHTADVLDAKKLKILSPIPKGRGQEILSKRLPSFRTVALFEELKRQKASMGWRVRITVTDWNRIREGHALLIHPDGEVVASPVWSKEGCVQVVGNILHEDIRTIWARYPYKRHHVDKYVENSLLVC
jgi:MoaA/NifB/PqqE/SkfB family radical SAM enzyme